MGKDSDGYSNDTRTVVYTSESTNTVNILREQIKELEKLIELKDKRIQELESSNQLKSPYTITYNPGAGGTVCLHSYDSTNPGMCSKCGHFRTYIY